MSTFRNGQKKLAVSMAVAALVGSRATYAQCPFSSNSTGTTSLSPTAANVNVQLPPDGVLNYTFVNIPAGTTVKFLRNQSNTPVTILTKGDVTIDGTIDVSGTDGNGATPGRGGPGGFDGGAGGRECGGKGLGPGGGAPGCCGLFQACAGAAGSFYPTYGNLTLTPLIGGSGGGGSNGPVGNQFGGGGGGGGGAILIASSGTINMNGVIQAYGAQVSSAGTSGAIRLIAQKITGSFRTPIYGGPNVISSIIRVEACDPEFDALGLDFPGYPYTFSKSPGPVMVSGLPTLRITSVSGMPPPATPLGSYTGAADVSLAAGTTTATVVLAAAGIPVDTQINVTVIPQSGQAATVMSVPPLAGTDANSTASVNVTLAAGRSLITASATVTIGGDSGGSGLRVIGSIDGEPIAKVRVAAAYGGKSSLTYITASGKEVSADSVTGL